MPRRRMIDPNIWQSEDFSNLSILAKLVFIGLFSHADDEGRGRAKPMYIKSILFPYDEKIRLIDIETALSEIALNLSVTFYSANNGKQYYALDHWSKWQSIDKPKPSQIPAPPDKTSCEGKDGDLSPMLPVPVGDASPTSSRRVADESRLNRKEEEKEKEVEKETTAHVREDAVGVVLADYVNRISPTASPYNLDILKGYAEVLGADVCKRAFDIALENNANNKWQYIKAILRNLQSQGVRCLADWEALESERENKGGAFSYDYGSTEGSL